MQAVGKGLNRGDYVVGTVSRELYSQKRNYVSGERINQYFCGLGKNQFLSSKYFLDIGNSGGIDGTHAPTLSSDN